ncbi:MAG TPA: IS110 family transposase [Candidatus Eisenbacteria bacterium]|jgi:transposase
MEPIVERCCGVDIGQAAVVACLLVGAAHQRPRKQVRTFRTFTPDLVALRDWLEAEGCTHVGMESTGVYWKPVYAVLEGHFELIVGNAHHIKNVPGRKTDVKDSEWLAELVRHGLIARSFVPPRPIRELRDLVRYRRKLVESRTAERNRLLKLLEQANIKLASVASNVFGVSGMDMLRALLDGTSTPGQMAQLARGRLRPKIAELERALDGYIHAHHRRLLEIQLRRLELIDLDLEAVDQLIESQLAPFREPHERLTQIPGVDAVVAAVLIAELGVDMRVFHSARHLAAWAGVSPGNDESAGKRKSGRATRGNVFLKTTLIEAATAASRKNGTYFKDKFHRLRARRGYKRAALAIAHKILVAAYHMLSTGADYRDLGESYLDRVRQHVVANHLVRRLQRLGYDVQLAPKVA